MIVTNWAWRYCTPKIFDGNVNGRWNTPFITSGFHYAAPIWRFCHNLRVISAKRLKAWRRRAEKRVDVWVMKALSSDLSSGHHLATRSVLPRHRLTCNENFISCHTAPFISLISSEFYKMFFISLTNKLQKYL